MTDLQQLSPVNVQILIPTPKFYRRLPSNLRPRWPSIPAPKISSNAPCRSCKERPGPTAPETPPAGGGRTRRSRVWPYRIRTLFMAMEVEGWGLIWGAGWSWPKRTRRKSQEDGLIDVNSPKVECFETFFVWTNWGTRCDDDLRDRKLRKDVRSDAEAAKIFEDMLISPVSWNACRYTIYYSGGYFFFFQSSWSWTHI